MKDQQSNDLRQEEQKVASDRWLARSEPAALPSITQEMMTHFLDFSPDALVIVNSAGTITLVNTHVATLFGYRHEDLIGQPLEVLLPERLRAAHLLQRAQYMSAPLPRPMGVGLNLVGQRKDGSEFPVDISLRPILIGQALYVTGAIRDMTAQRETERERVQLTERVRLQSKLLDLAHDAILVRDPQGRISSWNRGAEDLYGWTEQDVLGQVIHTFLQTRFPVSQESMNQLLEQRGFWEGDLIHTCRDGKQVIVESRQVVIRDEKGTPTAILAINRDITERRRLEQIEQEARAEAKAHLDVLRLILDRLPTAIFLVQGPQARLILANRAATELWGAEWQQGQPMEDFLAQQTIRLFSEDGRPLSCADSTVGRVMASGEAIYQSQMVVRRPDGPGLPILMSAIPLDSFHTFPRLPSAMAKVFAESERTVLVVHQDVVALKEAEYLKDEFISLATHELRTPVTVIAGYTDMLLRRAARGKEHMLDEWQGNKLEEMKQATQQLTKLTEDLLDVTRVQAGQFQLQLNPADLIPLTRQIVDRLQATTNRHRLFIQTSLPHLWATVDALRIEQILSNLLTNAIKYSPQGGPIEVTIWENAKTHEACFSVRDYGMGIPREQQAQIFGRFMRAENVRTAGITGTGLGLYLCRELVERHGGRICFESKEHAGSTFFFSLPCHAEAR